MGCIFGMSMVGPPNKNPVLIIYYIKILIIKVNKTIQIIKCKWCIEASTLFYTTTRSGRIIANTTNWRAAQYRNWWYECVGPWAWLPVYINNVHKLQVFFYYKSVFSQCSDWQWPLTTGTGIWKKGDVLGKTIERTRKIVKFVFTLCFIIMFYAWNKGHNNGVVGRARLRNHSSSHLISSTDILEQKQTIFVASKSR